MQDTLQTRTLPERYGSLLVHRRNNENFSY